MNDVFIVANEVIALPEQTEIIKIKQVLFVNYNEWDFMERKKDRKESILLISANNETSSLVKGYLQAAGYIVHFAEEIARGIEIAESLSPSLIIYDNYLNEHGVYQVLEKLGNNFSTAAIPFIFFTAKVNTEQFIRIFELGADAFILRPFKARQMLNIIENKIEKYKLAGEIAVNQYRLQNNSGDEIASEIDQSIFLGSANKKNMIRLKDIEYVQALGSYTTVFVVGKGKLITRKLLKNWEEVLPGTFFIKISRSAILNQNYINSIEKHNERAFQIRMQNSEESFPISQRFRTKVKTKLKDSLKTSGTA